MVLHGCKYVGHKANGLLLQSECTMFKPNLCQYVVTSDKSLYLRLFQSFQLSNEYHWEDAKKSVCSKAIKFSWKIVLRYKQKQFLFESTA